MIFLGLLAVAAAIAYLWEREYIDGTTAFFGLVLVGAVSLAQIVIVVLNTVAAALGAGW